MTDTTPGPRHVVDCTIIELEPAVIDPATRNVLRPAVLQLPTAQSVDLTDDETAAFQARLDGVATAAARQEDVAAASALVQLRMIRDRWLAQTDYVEVFLNSDASMSHLPQPIQDALTENADGWITWREALRNLPATDDLDQVAAVAAIQQVHATTDTFPAPWPQPPTAPVIHLT